MQVIYAINADVELRNYLQYGVEHTNYSVVNGLVVPTNDPESIYNMNLLYTGDVFKALYCEVDGWVKWNENSFTSGKLQNNDAVVYVEPTIPEEQPSEEGGSTEDVE